MKLRLLLALFAAFQIFLPAAADLADARVLAEAGGQAGAVHIEAERSADCPRGHPDDCALCHFATNLGHKSFGVMPAPVQTARRSIAFRDGERLLTSHVEGLPLSRAPPVS